MPKSSATVLWFTVPNFLYMVQTFTVHQLFIMKNELQTSPISTLLHGANIKYHKRDLLALLATCATLLMSDVVTIGQDEFKWPTWTDLDNED